VTDPIDCRFFEDQLDALVRGELPDHGRVALRAHAGACAACASLLRVQEHVHGPRLAALEAQVPEAWVASMWDDVQGALASPRERRAMGMRRGVRWAVPVLAAATVALLLASGLAFRALRRAEAREIVLSEQILDQQRRLAELEGPTVERAGAGAGLAASDAWVRSLRARREVTVAELRAALRALPADTRLISSSRAGVLDAAPFVPGVWREAFARLDATRRDVTAEDLLDLLDELDLAAGTSVPTARLLDLLS
jgi:hypothetical protein